MISLLPLAKHLQAMYLLCRYSGRSENMRTRIQKWGNSLALRLPKHLAQEVGLTDDSHVHVVARDGKLEIDPAVEEAPRPDG